MAHNKKYRAIALEVPPKAAAKKIKALKKKKPQKLHQGFRSPLPPLLSDEIEPLSSFATSTAAQALPRPKAVRPVSPTFPKPRRITCLICYEKIPLGAPYRLQCHHSGFHKACILDWLRRSARCPICDAHFPEYAPKPAAKTFTDDFHPLHFLPLSVMQAFPELAQSMGIPIVYEP